MMITKYQITATNPEGYNRTMARNMNRADADAYVTDLTERGYTDAIAFPEGF